MGFLCPARRCTLVHNSSGGRIRGVDIRSCPDCRDARGDCGYPCRAPGEDGDDRARVKPQGPQTTRITTGPLEGRSCPRGNGSGIAPDATCRTDYPLASPPRLPLCRHWRRAGGLVLFDPFDELSQTQDSRHFAGLLARRSEHAFRKVSPLERHGALRACRALSSAAMTFPSSGGAWKSLNSSAFIERSPNAKGYPEFLNPGALTPLELLPPLTNPLPLLYTWLNRFSKPVQICP
jgi:hypothetical protein